MTLTTADGSVAGFLSRSRLDFREARVAGRSPRGERHEFRHRGSTADACRRRPYCARPSRGLARDGARAAARLAALRPARAVALPRIALLPDLARHQGAL